MGVRIVFETHSTTEGNENGIATGWSAEMHAHRADYIDKSYPDGESWRQAATRVQSFVSDLLARWPGQRVLVIGHIATRWGFVHLLLGTPLEELSSRQFDWQPGWEYTAAETD